MFRAPGRQENPPPLDPPEPLELTITIPRTKFTAQVAPAETASDTQIKSFSHWC